MSSASLDLLSNASATGSAGRWPGGRGTFTVEGTFGGATVKLQCLGPNGTWIDLGTDATFTAAGVCGFELAMGQLRANVSGGSPSALYAKAVAMAD